MRHSGLHLLSFGAWVKARFLYLIDNADVGKETQHFSQRLERSKLLVPLLWIALQVAASDEKIWVKIQPVATFQVVVGVEVDGTEDSDGD